MERKKYIGEALLKNKPVKPLVFKLKDGSVKTQHINNEAVTPDKLSPEVMTEVVEPAARGVAQEEITAALPENLSGRLENVEQEAIKARDFKQEFGSETQYGMSQDALTKAMNRLNNDLKNVEGAEVGFRVTFSESIIVQNYYDPSAVTITVMTTDGQNADSIIVSVSTSSSITRIGWGSNTNALTCNYRPEDTTVFNIQVKQHGLSYNRNVTLKAYAPIEVITRNVDTKQPEVIGHKPETLKEDIRGFYPFTSGSSNNACSVYVKVPSGQSDNFHDMRINGISVPYYAVKREVRYVGIDDTYTIYRTYRLFNEGSYILEIV